MAISHMLATVEDWIGQAVNMVVGVVAVVGFALCRVVAGCVLILWYTLLLSPPFIVVWGMAFVAWHFASKFW